MLIGLRQKKCGEDSRDHRDHTGNDKGNCETVASSEAGDCRPENKSEAKGCPDEAKGFGTLFHFGRV